MASSDPQERDARRTFVRQMFDGIAGTYDLLNHLLSAGVDILWRRWTVDALELKAGWWILDLATGTADLGLEAAARDPGVRVVGADLSLPMLRLGDKKQKKGAGRMFLLCGDAQRLPFPDARFHAVTIGFGVRNFSDLNGGLHEVLRVLRPGGRLAVLEFSRPRAFLLSRVYLIYFKYILPGIGRLVSRNPLAYRYLYESVMGFPEGEAFRMRLTQAGFQDAVERRLTLGIATLYLAIKPGRRETQDGR
ncbi:MAG: ubiquinone/menaquinone biosynthesis methyltransferase [Gemmatimonadetes bacterium]|nr:ubiquinone/menaquinone biosynthesis methyltransferase [Gemmatimonadota bacterium]